MEKSFYSFAEIRDTAGVALRNTEGYREALQSIIRIASIEVDRIYPLLPKANDNIEIAELKKAIKSYKSGLYTHTLTEYLNSVIKQNDDMRELLDRLYKQKYECLPNIKCCCGGFFNTVEEYEKHLGVCTNG